MEQTVRLLIACTVLLIVVTRISYCCVVHYKDIFEPNEFAIAERGHFHKNIEKTEVRHGIVHAAGKEFEVSVNTPWTSGPWSETYHCS